MATVHLLFFNVVLEFSASLLLASALRMVSHCFPGDFPAGCPGARRSDGSLHVQLIGLRLCKAGAPAEGSGKLGTRLSGAGGGRSHFKGTMHGL